MTYDPNGIGDELYEMFAPVVGVFGDPNNNLRDYCRGLGGMLQPLDDIVKDDTNGEPGFSQTIDLVRAKDEWLPWLGQWVGYRVTEKRPEENQAAWSARERGRMVTRSAHRRGTVARMVEAMQEHLDAPKTVIILQRVSSAHTINAYYYTAQLTAGHTHAMIEAAALEQKAKGLILTVIGLSASSWDTLVANQATWTVVGTKFSSWNEVVSNPAKP